MSVIIPSFNYAHFVCQAIESALAQTYPNFEIIVVDDGSTDNTRKVLETYGDRIRYIHQTNMGLSAARNTGINAARGEFIALLDADDVWHPRKLEVLIEVFRRYPQFGLLGHSTHRDRPLNWMSIPDPAVLQPVLLSLQDLILRAPLPPSSVIMRRSCLVTIGLFDPSLRCVEDRDMWIRFASRFKVGKVHAELGWQRQHFASLSNKALAMEKAERQVLRHTFRNSPALRYRFLLRLRALSEASFGSSRVFKQNQQWPEATSRLVYSLLLWPWPRRRFEFEASSLRIRALLVVCRERLGLSGRVRSGGQIGGSEPEGGCVDPLPAASADTRTRS